MAQSQSLCKWRQFTHVVLCLLGVEPQIDLSGLQAVLFVWFVLSNVLCFWQQCILPKSSSWQEDMDHCVWCHLSLSYPTTHHPQFPDLVLLGSIDHHIHSLVHVHRVHHTWTGESSTFSVSSNLLGHEWMMMIHSLMWIQLMLHSWIAADSYWNHCCIKLWITIYIWNHILERRLQMWRIQLPSTWRLFSQAQQTFSLPLEVTPSPCMTDWLYTRRLLVGNPSLDGCWGWCFFYWLSRLLEDWRWVGRSEHSWNTQGCWRIVRG
jgi:hypothetical protein